MLLIFKLSCIDQSISQRNEGKWKNEQEASRKPKKNNLTKNGEDTNKT